ncbi:MAG: Jag N-terminal domain-containing protein [Deltaproteobacteria bacterium]|nr:Jag N-terminal domain-containing protein [Deltaproteobacteria bacterium]
MAVIEVEGKTVDEAIESACRELNVPREKLEIEVLSAGSTGIFGIVGTKKAKIRATLHEEKKEEKPEVAREREKPAMAREERKPEVVPEAGKPEVAREIEEITEKILGLMGLETTLKTRQEGHTLSIVVEGDKSGNLIGRQGQTIDALQYLLSRIVTRLSPEKMKIVLDSGGYRQRQKKYLTGLALRLAEKAKKTGKPVVTGALNAHDRRIIHLALEKDKSLKTSSRGEGAMKKIIISAGGKKETAPEPPNQEE